jgi:hypothetical protein
MFPIRNGLKLGDVLSPLVSNFPLEYAIRKVQENQDGLKVNGKQLLLYAYDVNMMGGIIRTTEKNAETLIGASKYE